MDNNGLMTTKEAIRYIQEYFDVKSSYALAKSLSDETLTVQSIQIHNYLKGRKPSKKVADRFNFVYGVTISDYHDKSGLKAAIDKERENL